MTKIHYPVFDKVLFIGPDINAKGGIASVLASYKKNFAPFHYLPTNSDKGKIPGYLNTVLCLVRMPFRRLAGRKILHVHYASGKSWYRKQIIMAWGRFLGYKIVAHCHSGEFKEFSKKTGYGKIGKALDKAVANIVLSKSWKDFFTNNLKAGNIWIINNIISRPPEIKEHIAKSQVTFLFLGEIWERKGVFDILEAVKKLKTQGYNFKVILGGKGEVEKLRSEISRLGIDDYIEFRGWMNAEQKNNAFNESDVLLLPSYAEGLPISILEAMSYGRGVLSTPVGGIPEIITYGVNGFLITPGNRDEIKDAMLEYIKNPQLASLQGQKSLNIISHFYPETVGAQLSKMYSDILEK